MLWATNLGLSGPHGEVLTAFVLNHNGNALTLSMAMRSEGATDPSSLRNLARDRRSTRPLTFGVVYKYSSHHILLRNWLRTAGLDPDRDVNIVVVPPAQMARNLAAGTLDGFCAGEPWNSLAISQGAGWCPTWSAVFSPGHLEKVVMLRRQTAERNADAHIALIKALDAAAAWCDEPSHRPDLAKMLAKTEYLNLPVEILTPALSGSFDTGVGREEIPDFLVFHRGGTNRPTVSQAESIQNDLISAGIINSNLITQDLPKRIFREDIYNNAINETSHLHAYAI
jgi:ABC-type nitrate/sulfonate/bicarbonate transport system substrate-binding protein